MLSPATTRTLGARCARTPSRARGRRPFARTSRLRCTTGSSSSCAPSLACAPCSRRTRRTVSGTISPQGVRKSRLFTVDSCAADYPLEREQHGKVTEGIAAHNEGRSATDPLTGVEVPAPAGADRETKDRLAAYDHYGDDELRAAAAMSSAESAAAVSRNHPSGFAGHAFGHSNTLLFAGSRSRAPSQSRSALWSPFSLSG